VIAQVEQSRAELEALCRRFQVRRLEVFGSAALGESRGEEIDLDFLNPYFREFVERTKVVLYAA